MPRWQELAVMAVGLTIFAVTALIVTLNAS